MIAERIKAIFGAILPGYRQYIYPPQIRPLYIMLAFFWSILVRQKYLESFEHFSGISLENWGFSSQKIKIETFLERNDDFNSKFKKLFNLTLIQPCR